MWVGGLHSRLVKRLSWIGGNKRKMVSSKTKSGGVRVRKETSKNPRKGSRHAGEDYKRKCHRCVPCPLCGAPDHPCELLQSLKLSCSATSFFFCSSPLLSGQNCWGASILQNGVTPGRFPMEKDWQLPSSVKPGKCVLIGGTAILQASMPRFLFPCGLRLLLRLCTWTGSSLNALILFRECSSLTLLYVTRGL